MPVDQRSTFVQQLRTLFLKQDATGATDESLLDAYLNQRDEAAFEALVRRHGPMVFGVCRRILGNCHDAEDAFQAAFLVLVRKAASIWPRSMVGNWLYGVACRTALDGRKATAKRRAKEATLLPRMQPPDGGRTDLRAVLDEELQRLPPKCRAVIILSDLEGKTRREVALQLGWPEGTVASRLARARARLEKRLARYGFAGSGALVGTLLSESASSASVPTSLVVSTVKTASLMAAGQAATGVIPAQIAALMEGALKAMLLNKVLKATVLLLVLVTLGTGTGLLLSHAGGTQTAEREATPADRTAFQARADVPGAEAGKQGTNEAKSDLDRVQGTWRVVSSQVGDEKAAEDEIKRRKITVKGNVMTYDYGTGDPKQVGTIKLDPKTKYLDWKITSPEAGITLALYEIKSDEWKIGFGNDGVIRPRSWAIGKDDVVWLLVLKREQPGKHVNRPVAPGGVLQGKDTPKEIDISKELAKLKAVWVCVGYERDGEEHVDQQARETMWNETLWFHGGPPKGDWLNLSWERKGVGQTSALAVLNLSRTTPKAIDLIWKSVPAKEFMPKDIDPAWEQATRNATKLDRAQPGVYSVEGNRLRLAWGELGGERPASPKTKRGDKWTVHLYEKKDAAPPPKSEKPAGGPAPRKAGPPGWLADASGADFPDQPAAGRLHGKPFRVGRARVTPTWSTSGNVGDPSAKQARLDGAVLWLQQEKDPVDCDSFTIFLTARLNDTVDGKSFVVPAGGLFKQTDEIMYDEGGKSWSYPVAGVQAESRGPDGKRRSDLVPKVTMRLELARRKDGRLPGKVYLCIENKKKEKSFVAGSFEAEVEEKPDLEEAKKLFGTWEATGGATGREQLSAEAVRDTRISFDYVTLLLREGGRTTKADYRLRVDASPKQIDLTLPGAETGVLVREPGAANPHVRFGIYRLERDSLTLCLAEPGQGRPTDFSAKGKPGPRVLLRFRRAPPDAK